MARYAKGDVVRFRARIALSAPDRIERSGCPCVVTDVRTYGDIALGYHVMFVCGYVLFAFGAELETLPE